MLVLDDQTIYFKSSEKMEELENGFIDLIITSPPYNRGKKYTSDQNMEYNDKKNEQEYFAFLKRVWTECYRVASKKGIFFLNIGDSADSQGISEKVLSEAEKVGWIRIQDIIWVKSLYGKGHYTPSGGSKRLNNIWEHIFLLVKDKTHYQIDPKKIGIPYTDKTNIGRYADSDIRDAGNVWHIPYEKTTGPIAKKRHAAPFPIGLPYRCISLVPEAETVLDPFLGIGTTLAASKLLKKKGVGYEKYPRKDLILETIMNTLYFPSEIILLPHYETTIVYLVNLLKKSKIALPKATSKKESDRQQILLDTLRKMKIDLFF